MVTALKLDGAYTDAKGLRSILLISQRHKNGNTLHLAWLRVFRPRKRKDTLSLKYYFCFRDDPVMMPSKVDLKS